MRDFPSICACCGVRTPYEICNGCAVRRQNVLDAAWAERSLELTSPATCGPVNVDGDGREVGASL